MTSSTSVRVLVAIVLIAACGSKSKRGDGAGDGGIDAAGPAVKALVIAPADTTVALTQAGLVFTATQPYTVTATFDDGTSADVSTKATLVSDDANAIGFAGAVANVHA